MNPKLNLRRQQHQRQHPTVVSCRSLAKSPRQDPTRTISVCPSCGHINQASFSFCGACGTRLKPPAANSPAGGAQKPAPENTPAIRVTGQLTLIRPDGSDGGIHPLKTGDNIIGRGRGPLFDADPYLSPRHAEFELSEQGLRVNDLSSLNGVFVKIAEEEEIESGEVFRIGQELLRFDLIEQPEPLDDGTEILGSPNPGFWGRITVIMGANDDGASFPIYDGELVLGRERGDIQFPEDGYVSGTHAQITLRDGRTYLRDLGSSNGTFVRIRGRKDVPSGRFMLMGQQLFRVMFQNN